MTAISKQAPTTARTAASRRAVRRGAARTGLYAGLTAGAIFAGFPVLWMLSSSFKSNANIFAYPPKLFDGSFSFAPYLAVFSDPVEIGYFANSYIVALSVTVVTLVVALLTGYVFSRYEFPLKRIISIVIIGVQAVPPITLLIPFFGIMVALGLYNTYQGLIITYVVFTLPYAVIMMTAYFDSLPKEVDEAAKVDGASSMSILWRILVPISVPGMVSVGLYTFMISWNEYLFALTLTQTDDRRTVPVGIQLLMGQNNYLWNEVMAMSILGSIPVLVLFLIFQRYFIGGLAAGAVKS
ncbi:carbohydrate ABC transporter permease [Sinomonas humi]|uniref:carbohydrate ABC transporter permease n=1 Tax=Sinomonas humi TaxID=1338436 RepID=UPI0009DD48F4|nr:carbohydrate ABC transporter permease [Sinomonas humi]